MSVTIHEDMMRAASYYEDGAALVYALLRWAEYGDEPSESEVWYPTFIAFQSRVQLSKEAHDNGAKGGRPRKDNPPSDSQETPVNNPPSGNPGNLKSREEMSIDEKSGRFRPPTVDEVRAYSEESGNPLDAQRFCDFYSSKGWRVGKSPMKDWRAAVRNWSRRENPRDGTLSVYDGQVVSL